MLGKGEEEEVEVEVEGEGEAARFELTLLLGLFGLLGGLLDLPDFLEEEGELTSLSLLSEGALGSCM